MKVHKAGGEGAEVPDCLNRQKKKDLSRLFSRKNHSSSAKKDLSWLLGKKKEICIAVIFGSCLVYVLPTNTRNGLHV